MLVLLVILCPPAAVFLTAPPSQAAKNFGLTLLFYVPGVLHARSAVERYYAQRQYDTLARLMETRTATPQPRHAA